MAGSASVRLAPHGGTGLKGVHPLQVKYGGSDPATWDDAKRAAAREELFNAISADKAGKAGGKLAAGERSALLRIWLDIRRAQTDAEAAQEAARLAAQDAAKNPQEAEPAPPPSVAPKAKRFSLTLPRPEFRRTRFAWSIIRSFKIPDLVFLNILVLLTVAVLWLGWHSVREVQRIEEVKSEAERVVSWLKVTADKRAEADFEPAACRKQDDTRWGDCAAALLQAKGPLHQRINPFIADHPLMQRKCDPSNWMTIGSIIIEKGVLQPSGTYSYTPFDGTEPMSKDMTLRVLVCGRGFHLIKVASEISL